MKEKLIGIGVEHIIIWIIMCLLISEFFCICYQEKKINIAGNYCIARAHIYNSSLNLFYGPLYIRK